MKHFIRYLPITITTVIILLTVSCSHVSPVTYDRFNNLNWQMSMDYPHTWLQQIDPKYPNVEVTFLGRIGGISANITTISLDDSYDTMFDILNSPKDIAKLEYKDAVTNNITYSTFTQVVSGVFTRVYICRLNDMTAMFSVNIESGASQNDKDTLNSYALHMAGSLQLKK